MPLYEHTFLLRHSLSTQQAATRTEKFSTVLIEGGGKVIDTEFWGLRNLAYRIRNNRKAHYVHMRIEAPSAAVQEMERQMSLNEDVLRVLTLRVDKHQEGASVVMRTKVKRDARRPRFRDEDGDGDGAENGGAASHDDDGPPPRKRRTSKSPRADDAAPSETAAVESASDAGDAAPPEAVAEEAVVEADDKKGDEG